MKTTIDIPDAVFKELIENTKAGTKREAIITAIKEYNRMRKISSLADAIGTFDKFMTNDELDASRKSD